MSQISPEPVNEPELLAPSPAPEPLPESLPLADKDLQALDDIFTGVDIETDGMETIIVFE